MTLFHAPECHLRVEVNVLDELYITHKLRSLQAREYSLINMFQMMWPYVLG